ncbi:MAG: thioredoxin-dependent thiol peroxidase [Leptospiraceae bacterium]|nr:thioredoxin-dependent thiol peroxidase [Leptospiraceae bacterium]
MLEAGKKIRDRKVTLTDGSEKKLSELAGRNGLVLYFYPKDSTPGCTTEACDFRDNLSRLKTKGYSVVGVSPDPVKSHRKFTEKQKLNFPLIADEDRKLCESMGVYGEKKLYGRTYMGVYRTTFLVTPDLKIQQVYKNVKVKGHVEQILKDVAVHTK